MKNTYTQLLAIGAVLVSTAVSAQTVSTFESLNLPANSYWNGDDSTHMGGFADGNAFFSNEYDFDFMYWSGGFAVSNKADTSTADTTSGYSRLYNAVTPGGAEQSASYAIVQNGSYLKLTGNAAGKQPAGLYITNSNYAYLSMKWGDAFGRQFTDSDFFILNIVGFSNGAESDTSLAYYLADGMDLVNTWQWIDLTSLGDVDSIGFFLESSDTGQFGMNTPGFFCIDNFTTRDIHTGTNQVAAQLRGINMYPNPATSSLTIETATEKAVATIIDLTGKHLKREQLVFGKNTLTIDGLTSGMYFVQVESNGITEIRKLLVK
jgi:hypothetical protein